MTDLKQLAQQVRDSLHDLLTAVKLHQEDTEYDNLTNWAACERAEKALAAADKLVEGLGNPVNVEHVCGMHISEIIEMQKWWNSRNPIGFSEFYRYAFESGIEAFAKQLNQPH